MNAHATAADLAPLHAVLDKAYPDRLREVAEHLFLQLVEEESAAPGPDRAEQLAGIALRQTERLSLALGGGNFYMHKGTSFRLTPRNREMCARFTGNNYEEVARDFGLSDMRARQIIDAWQLQEFRRRQVPMFKDENPGLQKPRRQGR